MSKKMTNVKIWTTLPQNVFDEVKQIGSDFGYAESELFRELIRRGLSSFKQLQQVRLPPKAPQEAGAILKVANEIGDFIKLDNISERIKNGWK